MKTNRFLLSAIFGLALAFTLSCSSDDDGGKTAACRWTESYNGITTDMCKEESRYLDEFKEDCIEDGGTYLGDSCPGGSSLKCKGQSGKSNYYFYNNVFKNCDEFEHWWYD